MIAWNPLRFDFEALARREASHILAPEDCPFLCDLRGEPGNPSDWITTFVSAAKVMRESPRWSNVECLINLPLRGERRCSSSPLEECGDEFSGEFEAR